jgi:hypothetical protein
MLCTVCESQLKLISALSASWMNNEKDLVNPNKMREAIAQIANDFKMEESLTLNTPPRGFTRKRGPMPKVKVKVNNMLITKLMEF